MQPLNNEKKFGFNILTKRKIDKDKDRHENLYKNGEFIKQNEELYDDDVIILQSILKYSETFGCNNYFKSRELSENHLLKNCSYYIKLYQDNKSKTTIKSRIENINNKVVELLGKLAYLELIDIEKCVAKNNELTEKYRFTKLGRLIGLLLLFEKRKVMIQSEFVELYKQIYAFYGTLNHSHAKLCLVFFEICYFRGKFYQIILRLTELLMNANDDKHFFLNELKFLGLFYQNLEMWDIYKRSLSLLRKYDIFAYHKIILNLKLDIEELQEVKVRNLKDFEISRLEKKQDIETVVVEGYCNSCKIFFTMSIKILDYLEYYIKSFVLNEYDDKFQCRYCKKDYLDFQTIVDI